MLEQLRRSGTASVKFSDAISHFIVIFTRAGRSERVIPEPGSNVESVGTAPTGRLAEILVAEGPVMPTAPSASRNRNRDRTRI